MGQARNQRVIGDGLQAQSERTLFITPTVTALETQMTPSDKAVIVTIATAITHKVKLPPVGEAMGEIYTIRVPDAGNGLTIEAYGDGSVDDAVDWTDLVAGDDNDFAVLLSDGYKWFVLVSDVD